MEVQLCSFFTLMLDKDESSAAYSSHFIACGAPSTQSMEGLVGSVSKSWWFQRSETLWTLLGLEP